MGKSKDLATGASAFYQDQTESDARYVNTAGDTMSGALTVGGAVTINPDADSSLEIKDGGTDAVFMTATTGDELYIGANGTYAIRIKSDGTKDVAFDNGSRVTMPSQPAFMVTMSTSPTYTGSSTTTLPWNSEIFDTGSNFDTSNYRFTAPVTGKYHMHLHFELHSDSNFNNSTWAYIGDYFINGTRATGADYWGHSYKYNLATNAAILQLNANDYVDVRAVPNGNTIRYSAGGYGNSRWFGYLIG